MSGLPVLESVSDCEGCGACCREVDSPPGYALVAAAHASADRARIARMTTSPDWSADVARWREMPEPLRFGLADFYRACGPEGDVWDGGPCLWWDGRTRRCRHYDWRPSICREFVAGTEPCLDWQRRHPPHRRATPLPPLLRE